MRKSPLSAHTSAIAIWLAENKTNVEITELLAEHFGVATTESSVRRAIERNSTLESAAQTRRIKQVAYAHAEAEGVDQTEDSLIITMPPNTPVEELDISDILRRRKLDPDEWEVKQILDNQWEANAGKGTKITLYQFKVWLARKVPINLVFPATVGPDLPEPQAPDVSEPMLIVVCGDQQAPHHDKRLHELFLRWLSRNEPAVGVVNGDLSDFGYISRHRDDPEWDVSTQECVEASFGILYDYRQASLDTQWMLSRGNHDIRIRNEMLERSERLYGVTAAHFPGDEPEEWAYSLNHLLHLKRLGIKYVEPRGSWEFEQVPLSAQISARHGHYVGKDAPTKMVVEAGRSVVMGHTHRQSLVRKTLWDAISGSWRVVTAVEAGCMCKIEGGLGFSNGGTPDWQQGFACITLFPDGQFTADLATYEQEGILRWRDQIYSI